jgi:hypothetical protein
MKILFTFLLAAFTLVSCNESNKKDINISEENSDNNNLTITEKIAYKNGLKKFETVNQIDFTFNVDRGDNHFERSWQWKPKTNVVTYITAKDTTTYSRAKLDSTSLQYDSAFINDKYWLLAPFNLVWDEGTSFSKPKKATAPISGKDINLLTITYSDEGGYTPGDAYDLYYGDDLLLKEWVYRKGNDSLPSMTTTWENYKEYNGIKIAAMHKDSLGDFSLYFTGIKVN